MMIAWERMRSAPGGELRRSGAFAKLAVVASASTAVLLVFATPMRAATALVRLFFSPDMPVTIGNVMVAPNQVVSDDLAGGVMRIAPAAVPTNAHITGYFQTADNHQLLTFDTPVTLPSVSGAIAITPRDVASFDGTKYSLYFSGAANDVPAGAAIDAGR